MILFLKHFVGLPIDFVNYPLCTVVSNPIVRAAQKAPVPNRWMKRNGFPIKDKPPIRRGERRHHFPATTTAAKVNDGAVWEGDIENALAEDVRDTIDEFMAERGH